MTGSSTVKTYIKYHSAFIIFASLRFYKVVNVPYLIGIISCLTCFRVTCLEWLSMKMYYSRKCEDAYLYTYHSYFNTDSHM